ncbi:hypothetical protein N8000_05840 [Rhodospirillales bacterium]|nr:hypothetical protein [Rhodospirillales bacterium]
MKNPRVALIGNMNNNFFSLARYLRDRGCNADVLTFNTEADHFLPEADTFDDQWKIYTKFLDWGDLESFVTLSRSQIAASLEGYDILIGCGPAPAFVERIGRRLDIFFPYGADIFELPFFKFKNYFSGQAVTYQNAKAQIYSWQFCKFQRAGIRNSRHIGFRKEGAQEFDFSHYLERIVKSASVVSMDLAAVYAPIAEQGMQIAPTEDMLDYLEPARELSEKMDAVIIHTSRHIWKPRPDKYSLKGNDVLFRGIAKLQKTYPLLKIGLITMEYGPDLNESRELCKSLGIEKNVLWLPLAPRKTLFALHRYADIAAAEFTNSWTVGGVLWEGMICEKPIMQFREDTLHQNCYEYLYPILNVSNSDDFEKAMIDFFADRERHALMGRECKNWYNVNIAKPCVDAVEKIINGEL